VTTFTDTFGRADSSNLGPDWVEVSGDWAILSGQLSPGSAGGTIILRAAGAMASNDHYAQVTIAATTAASHGLWIRGNSNISNGYLWRNDGSAWNLFSVVGGSFTVIGTYTAPAVAGDVAKVQAVGSTITAYVNGVQRTSVVDTSVATGTSVGLRSESTSAIKFDDFSAADISAGATLGTAGSTETAQPLTGAKSATLGPATETDTGQALTGSKAATLSVAGASESAQPLTGAKTATLGTASSVVTAQPLTGAKSTTLGPATETDTARPVAPAGGPDVDIDITVGTPYSSWAAGQPYAPAWTVQTPQGNDWEVNAPC
jgi:hypothetical protein